MEAVYKHGLGRKQGIRGFAETQAGEKKRMAQLFVSLGLFLLVFIGRGAFPGFAENIKSFMAEDMDFSIMLQKFEESIANDESLLNVLQQTLGAFREEPENKDDIQQSEAGTQKVYPELILLSETELHGLSYFREHGITPDIKIDTYKEEPKPEPMPEPVPKVVTAVAQAYNAEGMALPSNVSYEYYEFGLDETVTPVVGTLTSGFDYRISPFTGKREFHLALDIAAKTGTEIRSFADGVVRYIGESDEFGLYFMIDHDNGVATFYAHCSKLLVRKGESVLCGQTVALVGETGKATGPHLHFTIEKDGIRLNPAYYVDLP